MGAAKTLRRRYMKLLCKIGRNLSNYHVAMKRASYILMLFTFASAYIGGRNHW